MRSMAVVAALFCAPLSLQAQEATDSARRAEVLSVVHGYHADLAAGDSLAALARLHPELVVYESGHAETLAQYRAGHLAADIAFASAIRREITGEAVELFGDQALYTARSHSTGRWQDRDIDSQGVETMLLTRTPDGWRIRHIHWSSR